MKAGGRVLDSLIRAVRAWDIASPYRSLVAAHRHVSCTEVAPRESCGSLQIPYPINPILNESPLAQ
jgi:hypothetical protein